MTYQPALAPYSHQLEAQRKIAKRPKTPSGEDVFAFFCDMGTGKTKMVLDEFGEAITAGKLDSLLVVAPAGSYRNWFEDRGPAEPSELRKHLSRDLFDRLVIGYWKSGPTKAELAGMVRVVSTRDRPRVLVVNTESLSSVEDSQKLCREFLSTGRTMMVIDESTRIRNPRAKRTRTILELGKLASARRILTGFPTPKSPLDLYSQFDFLDWKILGHKTYWTYKMRYAITRRMIFGKRKVNMIVGYKNVEELQKIIEPYSFRVLKEDCLDIPPKIYQRREVDLTLEQKRIYQDLIGTASAQLKKDQYVSASNVIGLIQRLHQVASGYAVDEAGKIVEIDSRRLPALMDLLEEHSGKAIVWAPYDASIRKISVTLAEEYGAESVASYWGANRQTRGEDEKRFLTDPACRFMVSTPAAGGVGNNWVVADLVVYYANSYDLEHRTQSEDRAHRSGQTKPVTYVDIVSPGTVDEKILKSLRNKIDMATAISGDNYREWLI